ncbi:uncharacterized protein LOC112560512 [Pomacea canaliculata]|uniref:uncharacterized protein LOC112560512 n=1 Tax=Pomacea canaliculata TaxID=400727 RepID=UPI000D73EF94|nr:uncharacterized protein LOC112560512 [Pomacea canaliculata]
MHGPAKTATQGPVTGGQLSSTMANMCIENETVIANTSQCQAFSTCMGVLNLFPNVTVTPLLMMDVYINMSQPNFWCSHLSDLFTCLNNGTKICSLPANVTARVEQTYNNIVSLCSVYTPAPPERSTVPISGTNPLQDSLLLLLVSCMAAIMLRF